MATGDILILGTFHANTQDEVLVRAPQVQGTYIVVPDIKAMNAITNEVAIDGTLVYVVNAGTTTDGLTYSNTYRRVNGAWSEELMPAQVQNILSEKIDNLQDDVDDLKKDVEDLAKQDETILIGLTEITNIKNDVTIFKNNVTNKFTEIDNTFINIDVDIGKKFTKVNEDISRIEGALSGYELVLNLQNAQHNEDGTVVHNGSVTSEGFTYNYVDEETNEEKEVFIKPPTVDGYGSMMIGGYRYDAGELIGTDSEYKHQSFSHGNQTFGAGGGVKLWGDWDVGFGKNTTAYQKATFVMGGNSVAGMTKEEFVERWKDDKKNATVDKTTAGWEDLIVDQWGSTYDESYSFAASIGEICLAKGRGTFSFGSHAEAWGTYALAGGYKAIVKTKDYGLALGYEVQTLGEHGINIGRHTTLNGTSAINIGSYNNNSSLSENVSPAGYVTMIGNYLTTVRPYQIALGRYNITHKDVVSVFQVADGRKDAEYDVISVYKTRPDLSDTASAEYLYGNDAKYTVEIKGNVSVTKGQGTDKYGKPLGNGGKFTADYLSVGGDSRSCSLYLTEWINGEQCDVIKLSPTGIMQLDYYSGGFNISVVSPNVDAITIQYPYQNVKLCSNTTGGGRNTLVLCDNVVYGSKSSNAILVGQSTNIGNIAHSTVVGIKINGSNIINSLILGTDITAGDKTENGVDNLISLNNSLMIGEYLQTRRSNSYMLGNHLSLGRSSQGIALGRYNQNISLPDEFVKEETYKESILELGDGDLDPNGNIRPYNVLAIYKNYPVDKDGNHWRRYGNAAAYTAEFKANISVTRGLGEGKGNGGRVTADNMTCYNSPTANTDVVRKIEIDKIRTWTEFYWYQNDFEVTTADKSKVTFVPTQLVDINNPNSGALRVFVNRELRLMSITGRLRVTVSAKLSTRLAVTVKHASIKKAIGEEGVTDQASGFRNMTAEIPISVTYLSSSGVEILPQGGYINMLKTRLSFNLFETYVEPRAAGTYMFNVNATFFY